MNRRRANMNKSHCGDFAPFFAANNNPYLGIPFDFTSKNSLCIFNSTGRPLFWSFLQLLCILELITDYVTNIDGCIGASDTAVREKNAAVVKKSVDGIVKNVTPFLRCLLPIFVLEKLGISL